jgi:phage tail-like protein
MSGEEPFPALNFRVAIAPPGGGEPLCGAAFAECEGLELSLDVRTVHEGGDRTRQRLLAGRAAYGRVTLRRGMTSSFDLWRWASSVLDDPGLRADARVEMLAPDGEEVRAAFLLSRCLPVRLRAPALDARHGAIAIEELELACEQLVLAGHAPRREKLAKAQLRDLEDGRVAPVQLNPERLHVAHDADGPLLSLQLAFEAAAGRDVRELTAPVTRLAAPRRPVRFQWGPFRFDGRVATLQETFDLFAADGRPIRSALALALKQPPPSNTPPQ